jgi:tetratricopeptide (TPR) repeat protein
MKSILIRFVLISFLLVLFIPNSALAEMKTFIKEYTYNASEADSKLSSRINATAEVKRLLLEELGTYLESITEVKNFQLTKDQITTLTAGIVKTEIIAEKWNGEQYWIKTKIFVDADDVIKSIDKLRKDRNNLQELENTRKRVDVILEENNKLRNELARTPGNAKQEVQQRYDNSIKELSAVEWLQRGYSYYVKEDYETAINNYSKAIELYPNYDRAYIARAFAYSKLGRKKEAKQDAIKAMAIRRNR